MNQIKIETHIKEDHREYAKYDNERNIPHIADGLKTAQRKIIDTVIHTVKAGDKEVKVANIGSRASDRTHYQHGEDSIIDAVVNLARDFPGSNNYPLLLRQGQFGNKLDHDNSEPRYIFIKRHAHLDNVLDKDDAPILTLQTYDGDDIEPAFFLPKVPLLLVNGSRGVGNGYSARILPRSMESVKSAIRAHLKGQEYTLPPSFNGFTGKIIQKGSQYQITGTFEKVSRTSLKITDLPPDSTYQYEQYKNRTLLKLLDNKEIRSISDDSKEDQWNILLEAPQAFCSMDHDKLVAKLGLTLSLTETLNCWGWDGKIHMFDTVQELLGYWIEGRLVYLEKRRLSKIERLAADATWLDVKRRFISMWNADSQTLVTLKKDGLYRAIKLALSVDDETVARLLSSNIMSLTSTQVEELDKQIKEINAKIDSLKTTTPQAMMLTDIDSVK